MKILVVALGLGLTGCFGAHRSGTVGDQPDGGTSQDALTCGSLTCDQTPASTCFDTVTLQTYQAACADNACSYPETDVACGAGGCCTDHCCEPEPSNSDVFGEVMPTGVTIAHASGTFDTDTQCVAGAALGNCTVAQRSSDSELGEACVCRADDVTIGSLTITGARALVVFANHTVTIEGTLSVSGVSAIPGPGTSMAYTSSETGLLSGVGGSYQTAGGGSSGVSAAGPFGNATLVPLLGGMNGQDAAGGHGGGAGGAVQITAGSSITIDGTINAGGGGGVGGGVTVNTAGAGGGGSGGAILLEAPTVTIGGSLFANGGGGGGGGTNINFGGNGGDASATAGSGANVTVGTGCDASGDINGGAGGTGASVTTAAAAGGPADYSTICFGDPSFGGNGGGGGGLGRIRINTLTGCDCSTTSSPVPTLGSLVVH